MLLILAAAGTAHADDTAHVDWARGLVIAGGVGVADRHAPSPAVARGTARRGAEDAAKAALTAAIATLPRAAGGTVGDGAARALDAPITLDAEPETDGAWHVTLAVPLEAVRQALAGPRTATEKGDAGPPVIVVDGVPASAKPAIGWTIGGLSCATLWVRAAPAWAQDAPHVKATGAKAGAITAALPPDASAATLFVIVAPS